MENGEHVVIEKGTDIASLIAAMKNGDGDFFKYAAMNRGQDDFKWLIWLAVLARGGIFGDSARDNATEFINQNISNLKDTIVAGNASIKDMNAVCCSDMKDLLFQQNISTRDAFSSMQQENAACFANLANGHGEIRKDICEVEGKLCSEHGNTRAAIQASESVLSRELCDLQHALDKCCCATQLEIERSSNRTNQSVSDLGYRVQTGFSGVDKAICDQTNTLMAQGVQNTQTILNGQQRIVDLLNGQERDRLLSENNQLKTQALISDQTQQLMWACGCCPPSNCHGGHHRNGRSNGSFVPPGQQ